MKNNRQGRILSLKGGGAIRSLSNPDGGTRHWVLPEAQPWSRFWPLMLTLPLFAQIFHYMIDVGPLYLLSKAWAVLMLPFALYGIVGLRNRFAPIYLITLIYALGVTPVLSMMWLGNGISDAIANSIKIWSLTYYFSLLGLLVWLEPTADLLVSVVLRLGAATIFVMWLLWFTVPNSSYSGDPTVSRLFLFEYERGNRVYFPMTFALLAMFYALARMVEQPRLWQFFVVPIVLATEILLFKERMALLSCLIVMAGMVIFRLPKLWRSVALFGAVTTGVIGLWVVVSRLELITQSLGGSLSIRQNSMTLLENYLAAQPLRWVFGVGAASRVGTVNMADIIGRKDFFLADLGWAGIVFEFGAVGAVLMMLLYGSALRWSWRQKPATEPVHRAMIGALTAYIAYLAISTAVYSPVYTPGELASMTALLLYLVTIAKGDGIPPRKSRTLL